MTDQETTHVAPPLVTVTMPVREPQQHSAPVERAPLAIREFLRKRGSGKAADGVFGGLMLACALSIIAIVLLIIFMLVQNSKLSLHEFGFKFFLRTAWNPVVGDFGALPFIYGTIVSSILALCIAVPLALCVAIFIMEICPQFLRGPVAFLTELLAAIPSVVYGLWAVFVLVPIVRDKLGPVLAKTLGWTGFFTGSNFGEGVLTASIILSIMILPVISSITREVMGAVPISQKEGCACARRHALGDDPYCRAA